jgi:adenylylsulfate kinase
MKILVMGLPGSGKTTLARSLVKILNAVHWNADEVRANINTHLGFSMQDRLEQARRMGWLCQQVSKAGYIAVADFVCPTSDTRRAFDPDYTVFMNTIDSGRFDDTNAIFETPNSDTIDYIVGKFDADYYAELIAIDIHKKKVD